MATGISSISTWVDVCNRALAKIGNVTISSLTEGSDAQKYCSLFLPEVIAETLDRFDHQATIKELELALDTETPLLDYAYQYKLPADFLRMIAVETDGDEYVVEGNYIKTDTNPVYIKYISMPETPVVLPPHIIRAITSELALKLAPPLTSDEALYARVDREASKAKKGSKITEASNKVQTGYYEEMGFNWYDELR